ncbi:MAG: SLATT domain-containing protein [Methylococcales bacterium]
MKSIITMIIWYLTKKRLPSLCSRVLHFLAIMFAGFGGLCPLLQNLGGHNFNQLGYVSLGLVAAILGFDKFFGFNSLG